MISLVMTIFNKEAILENIIKHVFMTSEIIQEYIFILDGCKDGSEDIIKRCVSNYPNKNIKILKTPDVFEIKSNNTGLRACGNEYAVIVQDDMLLLDKSAVVDVLEKTLGQHMDVCISRIQKLFNVLCLNNPVFFQNDECDVKNSYATQIKFS
jgi:glycosyltransferase involved in cell wall biosynthesis